MKWFAVIAALFLVLSGARAEGPDDQYLRIYGMIQEADKLSSTGQINDALQKYREAEAALQRFQKGFPDWNVQVITFRLKDVAEKITAISARLPKPATPAPATPGTNAAAPPSVSSAPPARSGPPGDWQFQLNALTDQVRQLQADKTVLEAKLKEALAVQPAAVDPRTLARAENQIRGLQKENELLQVSLAQEKAKPLPAPDTKALDETRQALAEANRKLAEETKAANALTVEKTALQNKLNNLAATPANAAELGAAKKALAEANLKLADQTKLAAGLALEKESLQARLKTLTAQADTATALNLENQLLKKQVADLKAAPPPAGKDGEASRQLAQAQAQLAALQSDKEMLELQKLALENRVKQLAAAPATPATPATPAATAKTNDAARIKQLERERDDLKKSLAAANKELYSRKGKAAAAHLAEVENQLATLRSRLAVIEARQVPYRPEELALLKQPDTQLALAHHKDDRKSVKDLPPGTVALVAEANRYYANKQFDKAEEKYLQVLQQDKTNVPTLANLAAIELALGHLETAEINIKQAVALDPEDAYSFFVLGRLRFAQKQYDAAVDALSRAAQLDPQDAQTENLLGLALSEKGLRGPAETALRKAIEIDPACADAHNNLAVIYISQQPPLPELARWHYQKALAAGHAPNPELEKMLDARKADSGQ